MIAFSLDDVQIVQVDHLSSLFKMAVDVEFEVFKHEGFLDVGDEKAQRLQGYMEYDANSVFRLALLEGVPIAAFRLIHSDQRGYKSFKTINDFPETLDSVTSVGAEDILELGTVAILPEYRGTGLAFLLYHHAFRCQKKLWILSVDEGLVSKNRARFGMFCEPAGITRFYMGSRTTPIVIWIEKAIESARQHHPDMLMDT